jgi:hypothetical protein
LRGQSGNNLHRVIKVDTFAGNDECEAVGTAISGGWGVGDIAINPDDLLRDLSVGWRNPEVEDLGRANRAGVMPSMGARAAAAGNLDRPCRRSPGLNAAASGNADPGFLSACRGGGGHTVLHNLLSHTSRHRLSQKKHANVAAKHDRGSTDRPVHFLGPLIVHTKSRSIKHLR